MERTNQGKSKRLLRWMAVLAMPLFLASCASVRQAISENFQDKGGSFRKKRIAVNLKVVLKAAPRHLLVAPRTDYVWLWNLPGTPAARAIRVKKVPSGTPGQVTELEPEAVSHELWASINLENYGRQPLTWVKVKTRYGSGWVRKDFIEAR